MTAIQLYYISNLRTLQQPDKKPTHPDNEVLDHFDEGRNRYIGYHL